MNHRNAYIPGEYEEHEGTLLLYPYRSDLWRSKCLPIQRDIIKLADLISEYEKVYLGVIPELKEYVRSLVNEKVNVFETEYDDIWVRDTFPCVFRKRDKFYAVDWIFNAWGGYLKGLMPSWELDDAFGRQISNYFGFRCIEANLVCENGALLFDGVDTLVITVNTIINDNRNPGLTIEAAERKLKELLPIRHVLWLEKGLVYDETDGHIDNLCSFVNRKELLLAWTDDPFDVNYEVCTSAYHRIQEFCKKTKKEYIIHKIPLPDIKKRTITECEDMDIGEETIERYLGEILLGSYLNFIYVSGGVILPIFNCPEDEIAIQRFTEIFKDRKVIPFQSREFILGGGNIHCATHHIPELNNGGKR